MKKECPSCHRNLGRKLLLSKSIPSNDNKTKGVAFKCPYCEASIVINTHESEVKYQKIMLTMMALTLLPVFIFRDAWTVYLLIIAGICVMACSIIMIKNENVELKDWPRWKVLDE